MFVKIRNRLTILYTAVMAIFLLSFVFISYFLLSQMIYNDRISEVTNLNNKEVAKHKSEFFESHKDKDEEHVPNTELPKPGKETYTGNSYFYYFIDTNGQYLVGGETEEIQTNQALHEAILSKIVAWKPTGQAVRFENFSTGNTTLYLAVAGIPVFDKAGAVQLGTFYTGVDLTEQHKVLETYMMVSIILSVIFLILSSILGHYLAGKAMGPIMQSFARQREFVADASHELRTPLSVLQSSIEVIETEDENEFNDFSKQVLLDMKDEVGRMGKLVGDLLTLARADSGTLELNKESFDLRGVGDQIERTLQPIFAKKDLTFIYNADDRIPVFADRERLTQLLYILLDNAMKYTPEKGEISLHLHQSGKGVSIAVKDTGIGMTSQQAERVFDRFYRVDKGRSREMGGTGLGLAIANWIVKAHGGTISVESRPGQGSTFTIFLPIQEKEFRLP